MSRRLTTIYDVKLNASDGDIGKISDFYFDDQTFEIRYAVADTGTWLKERLVLLSPYSFGRLDLDHNVLVVELSRKQIGESPSMELHRPVSRQYEEEYLTYYGWPYYWTDDVIFGSGGYVPTSEEIRAGMEAKKERQLRDDPHLRSSRTVTGYEIETSDGTIGHVRDFLVDEKTWAIQHLLVEAGHWYSGKEILIPTGKINRISYGESKVYVDLTRDDIERTGAHDIAGAHS